MSVLTKVLSEEVHRREEAAIKAWKTQKYRLTHHLMPISGWLNDPNGLCSFDGKYHVFFQYGAFDVEGGVKLWGHYSSEDFIHWDYQGAPLLPDSPMDCHGVYSGSALVDDNTMHIFYSGNVKLEGDYDYINNGREVSVLHTKSEDGEHFGIKETAISFRQYPKNYTCHIRDPKVWKESGVYYIILGGRLKEDKGAVLIFSSKDLKQWELKKELTSEETFGYMWECPDYFKLGDRQILAISPQGVEQEQYRYQNLYQSGYFIIDDSEKKIDASSFQEWDMGFDFYAAQTFEDTKGRRILIGWMGMPAEEKEYRNLTIEEGWQHCLTIPRELTFCDGKILQNPVKELQNLRKERRVFSEEQGQITADGPFELRVDFTENDTLDDKKEQKVCVSVSDDIVLEYSNGVIKLLLSKQAGAGRKCRKAYLEQLRNIQILKDTSAVEIYLNDGEMVFSTRYYPKNQHNNIKIQSSSFEAQIWELEEMEFQLE